MKKLCTIYPYGLNERAKNSNLEQPTGKLFPLLPRFGNRRENLEKRCVNEPTKFDAIDTLLSKAVSNVLKLIYSQTEKFHRKSKLFG